MRPAKLSAVTKAAHYPDNPRPMPVRLFRPVACTALAALTLVLAACGAPRHAARPAPPPSREWRLVAPADPVRANAVLIRALGLVGTPYRYGGSRPEDGFDCSGLVNYVYREILDLRLPRSARELAGWSGPKVEPERLAAADLVFFAHGNGVDHVGIYVGQGRFVHAPSSGGAVRMDHLDGAYWRARYAGSKRVLR